MSDDTLPPNEPPTLDDLEPLAEAANDAEPFEAIPAGFAQHALSLALDDLHRALLAVEGVAMAMARQLDDQARQVTP